MFGKGIKMFDLVVKLLNKVISSDAFILLVWFLVIGTFSFLIYTIGLHTVDFSFYHDNYTW